MNNFNYNMALLEEQIHNVLQSIELPVGASYLIVSKIAKNLETLYNQQVQTEQRSIIEAANARQKAMEEALQLNPSEEQKQTENEEGEE